MTETAYENAVARRDAMLAEIKRHKERIRVLRKDAKSISDWLAGYSRYRDAPEWSPPGTRPRPMNPAKELVTEQVRLLLEKNGAPMSRSDLTSGLAKQGVILEGKNPEMVLSTMLWRMNSKVVRLKKFGYWLADRDFAPAGYTVAAPA